ncbi:hypothetical protein NIES4071_00760 [Calothrix sp. NIES-4071]|nr:hypothetical protein NIES4071_00760 [Calothrix sp. NIES-4071]BAZ54422.1 hypothetical protein NIES4105_00750 [Calothrix sp. NIES-4105]
MCTISIEELLEESKEIVNSNILNEKLENLFSRACPAPVVFKEKFHEILVLLESLRKAKSLKTIISKLYELSESIKALADKDFDLITEEDYESLLSISDELELWGDVYTSRAKIDKALTEKSSLATLRQWSEWIELFVEAINRDENKLPLGNWPNLEKLAQAIVEITFITNRKETKKNHYKRILNTSAKLILSKIESSKQIESWPLEVGKKSYQELLRESQKRIHMLDDLDPKTNEEAKEQSDTLEYLKKHLECR